MSTESAACSIEAKIVRTKSEEAGRRALCNFIDVFLEVTMLVAKPGTPLPTGAIRGHQNFRQLVTLLPDTGARTAQLWQVVATERVCEVRHNFRCFRNDSGRTRRGTSGLRSNEPVVVKRPIVCVPAKTPCRGARQ